MTKVAINSPLAEIRPSDPCVADTVEPRILLHGMQSIVWKINSNQTSGGGTHVEAICGGGGASTGGAGFPGAIPLF